jgi:drug/metabolite transporter (DMT)-like permease
MGRSLPRPGRMWGSLAALGLINTALPFSLITWAERYVDSGTASVLNSLTPVFSLLLSVSVLHDGFMTRLRGLGVLIGFLGAVLLASREFSFRPSVEAVLGTAAVTGAAASYAIGAAYSKRRMATSNRLVVAASTLLIAAVCATTVALVTDGPATIPAHTDALIAVAWLGLLGSCLAYLLYFYLIDTIGPTAATTVSYLFPVVGVGLGVTILDETLDARLIVGTTLVLVGVILLGLPRRRSPRRPGFASDVEPRSIPSASQVAHDASRSAATSSEATSPSIPPSPGDKSSGPSSR